MFKYKNVLMGLYIWCIHEVREKMDGRETWRRIIQNKWENIFLYHFCTVRAYNDGDKRCWMKYYCEEFATFDGRMGKVLPNLCD